MLKNLARTCGNWLPIAIRYTKITMPSKQLIEFICRKANQCRYFLRKAETFFGVCIVKKTLILRVQLQYRIVEEVFD